MAITVTDVNDWEAVPIRPMSPMRYACHKEINDVGFFNANTVILKASSEYGSLQILHGRHQNRDHCLK